jgi:hypothetical protein
MALALDASTIDKHTSIIDNLASSMMPPSSILRDRRRRGFLLASSDRKSLGDLNEAAGAAADRQPGDSSQRKVRHRRYCL